MTRFENDREPRLGYLAGGVDDDDSFDGVIKGVEDRAPARWRRRGVAFGVGVAVAVVIALLARGYVHHTNSNTTEVAKGAAGHQTVPGGDTLGMVEPGQPCPGARHASTVAGLVTSVPIWAPANATLSDSWTCGDTPVLMFGEIQVTYESGWTGVDNASKWADMATDYGGSVQTILGRPAYVHEATATAPRSSVSFVVGDTLVQVVAKDGVPIDDIANLARSIELPADLAK
jgi:hypothetical protein